MGIRCADHVTPLYPQKLALTSPTGGGHSVGVVRSRTKATELLLFAAKRKLYGVPAVKFKPRILLKEPTRVFLTFYHNQRVMFL